MDLRETGEQPRHPWELARLEFFVAALRRHGLLGRPVSLLDVGSGDAWFSSQVAGLLPAGSHISCLDPGYDEATLQRLQEQVPPMLSLHREPPPGQFDAVVLLDVLEHVADDRGFLQSIVASSLRPGGLAVISVPAWQALFTQHDTFLHHHRRYSPALARQVTKAAGLQLLESGGLFHSLLLPRALGKLREAALGAAEDTTPSIAWNHGPLLTKAVLGALQVDGAVSQLLARTGLSVPGLSWWAVGQKLV